MCRRIILILLIIGGVESNPGPPTRQTKFSASGDLNASELSEDQSIKKLLKDLNSKMDAMATDIKNIRETIGAVSEENKEIKKKLNALNEKVDKMEDMERKRNIIVTGLDKEEDKSDPDVFRKMVVERLGLSPAYSNKLMIERSFRFKQTKKQQNENKPADLVIKLCQAEDKTIILQAARESKPEGIFIKEDFSKEVRRARSGLVKEMLRARKTDSLKAYLSYNKLIVENGDKRNCYGYDTDKDKILTLKQEFPYSLMEKDVESDDDGDANNAEIK